MAKNMVIGALRVTLSANSAQFEKALSRSRATLGSLGKVMARTGAVMATAFAGAAIAAGRALGNFSAEADKMAKLSRSIGIPVDELSRLKHAADLSGVGLDALGNAVKRASVNMAEVAGGAANTASRAFAAMGIDVVDVSGKMKSSTAVMTEVAKRFQGMEDGAQKTSLAIAIFGRAGASLIPLLNSGADGIAKMMAEADELGIVLDKKTATAAEAFNDNLTRMKRVAGGITTKLAAEMLPTLANLGGMLVDVAKDSGLLEDAAAVLSFSLKGLITTGVLVGAVFKGLYTVVRSVAFALMNVAKGQFALAWAAMADGGRDLVQTMDGTTDIIKKIWSDAAENSAAEAARISALGRISFKGVEAAASSSSKGIAKAIDEAGGAGESLADTMQTVTDRLGAGLVDAATGARDLRDVLQDVAKELATESIRSFLPMLLKGAFGGGSGGPLNISPGASQASGIGGLLSAIPSLFGFAEGGSFKVGGMGGIDSQLVAFNASPNEMVTVTKPGQTIGGGAPEINIFNDFRGADGASEARIMSQLGQLKREIPRMVDNQVLDTNRRKGGYR